MKKRASIIIVIIVSITVILGIAASLQNDTIDHINKEEITADVIMPSKVSRPGCEKNNNCYVPTQISIKQGDSVTWLNGDSAFHSVTSGVYGMRTELFDSKYIDPGDIFSYTFEESGEFVYHCTLHQWMQGMVLVN